MSRDQVGHTLPGATVMEGAVKVTSGAANSRWDPRLRGGGRDFSQRCFLPLISPAASD